MQRRFYLGENNLFTWQLDDLCDFMRIHMNSKLITPSCKHDVIDLAVNICFAVVMITSQITEEERRGDTSHLSRLQPCGRRTAFVRTSHVIRFMCTSLETKEVP